MKKLHKLSIIASLLLALTFVSNAQVSLGLKAGLNLSKLSRGTDGISIDPKIRPGFHAGLIAEVPLQRNISFQPGILYSAKGANYKVDELEFSLSPAFIEVPLNFAYSFGPDNMRVFLFAGPYAAYGVAGKTEFEGISESLTWGNDDEDDIKPLDFGVNFGAGINLSNFLISAQCSLGLANLSTYSGGMVDTVMKNTVFGISVGYLFAGR